MSISRVQGNTATAGSVTSFAITLGAGVTLGNLVVVAIGVNKASDTITAPDSSWHQAAFNNPAGTNAPEIAIWYMIVDASHAGGTSWTWTLGTANASRSCIEEWHATNGWPASPVDSTAVGDTSGTPTAATVIDSGTGPTTTQAEELWIGALIYRTGPLTESSLTAGWTSDLEAQTGTICTATMLYKIASATGAPDVNYTITSAQFWAGCVATFKDTLAGGVTHLLICDGYGGVFS